MKTGLVLLSLVLAGCSGTPPAPAPQAKKVVEEPVKITMFYASAESSGAPLLCYGVENARAVRLDPPAEELRPAVSKCFSVTPKKATTYTLHATGSDGKEVTQTARVEPGHRVAAAPSGQADRASEGLRIVAFRKETKNGNPSLCYEVAGAEAVAVEPHALPKNPASQGCFYIAPNGPTEYTLQAFGKGGKVVERKLTVTP